MSSLLRNKKISKQYSARFLISAKLGQKKEFVSHQRVSNFPERGADLWEGPVASGEVQGTSGEVWGASGKSREALEIDSERSSGKVTRNFWGNSRKFREVQGPFQKLWGSLTFSQRQLSPRNHACFLGVAMLWNWVCTCDLKGLRRTCGPCYSLRSGGIGKS